MDKVTNDVRVYTDIQGLESLRGQYKSNPDKVKKEVAQQFESLLMQMLLHSMRDANKAFESDLLSSSDMSMYQDMFDKQISLSLSSRGIGFAQCIEDQIDRQMGEGTDIKMPIATLGADKSIAILPKEKPANTLSKNELAVLAGARPETKSETVVEKNSFKTPREFVNGLWASAKQAASVIGVNPGLLLAQAALETDWGKKIISPTPGKSSHNLFNIKSGVEWKKDSVRTATLEQKDGVLVKETANFRSYESFKESLMDYARMITNNPRYQQALEKAHEPAAYASALQTAGYATDENYSSKIMEIFNSPRFQALVAELK